jgi:hypothetical protein
MFVNKKINKMTKLSFLEFKEKTRFKFMENPGVEYKDPLDFLYSIDWNIMTGPALAEEQIALANVSISDDSCFGQILRATVLLEQHFPETEIFFGEVLEDFFRNYLLKSPKWSDRSFIEEVLQYEAPHSIIVFQDGSQFDPLFKELSFSPKTLKHPCVASYDIWEALYATYLISYSFLVSDQAGFVGYALDVLEEAKTYSSEMILIKENMTSMLLLSGRTNEAIELAESILAKRQDARLHFFLWCLTEDEKYKNHIIREYDVEMFKVLTEKIAI